MPTYNESEAIQVVLNDWIRVFNNLIGDKPDDYTILIINDGSTDDTADKITSMNNPHIMLINQPNSGHGKALYNGYTKAVSMKPDYIFQTDSDGQTNPDEFRLLWDARNASSVIMGYRKHRQDGVFRWFSTRVLRIVFTILFHHRIVDANTPFRLMPTSVLSKALTVIPAYPDFTNILLTGAWVHDNTSIRFVETSFKPRGTGVNSVNMRNMSAKGLTAISEMIRLKKSFKNFSKEYNQL